MMNFTYIAQEIGDDTADAREGICINYLSLNYSLLSSSHEVIREEEMESAADLKRAAFFARHCFFRLKLQQQRLCMSLLSFCLSFPVRMHNKDTKTKNTAWQVISLDTRPYLISRSFLQSLDISWVVLQWLSRGSVHLWRLLKETVRYNKRHGDFKRISF